MRKFIVITIPIVTLVLFLVIMLSGDFLKQSLGGDDNIPQAIETIMQDVNQGDWEAAKQNTDHLNDVWDRIVTRVQFSSERDEINDFSMNVARVKGAVQAKDKSIVLTELSEAYEHWRGLGK